MFRTNKACERFLELLHLLSLRNHARAEDFVDERGVAFPDEGVIEGMDVDRIAVDQ